MWGGEFRVAGVLHGSSHNPVENCHGHCPSGFHSGLEWKAFLSLYSASRDLIVALWCKIMGRNEKR